MNRFLHTRYGLFAGGVVLGLGLVGLMAGTLHAQVRPKTTALPAQTVQKQKKPYVMRVPTERVLASLNERIRMHAESLLGKQVGGGECTDLVNETLGFCNAKQLRVLADGSYEWGQNVALTDAKGNAAVIPGDILQFENVVFKGGGYTYNYPHHTAIVRSVNGKQIELLHQNVNNVRRVLTGSINLDHLHPGGSIKAYRPQPR
jgi:hypothetical protein